MNNPVWVLRIKLRSSVRAIHTLLSNLSSPETLNLKLSIRLYGGDEMKIRISLRWIQVSGLKLFKQLKSQIQRNKTES